MFIQVSFRRSPRKISISSIHDVEKITALRRDIASAFVALPERGNPLVGKLQTLFQKAEAQMRKIFGTGLTWVPGVIRVNPFTGRSSRTPLAGLSIQFPDGSDSIRQVNYVMKVVMMVEWLQRWGAVTSLSEQPFKAETFSKVIAMESIIDGKTLTRCDFPSQRVTPPTPTPEAPLAQETPTPAPEERQEGRIDSIPSIAERLEALRTDAERAASERAAAAADRELRARAAAARATDDAAAAAARTAAREFEAQLAAAAQRLNAHRNANINEDQTSRDARDHEDYGSYNCDNTHP